MIGSHQYPINVPWISEVSVPLSISLGIASAGGDPSAPLMGTLDILGATN